jgi:uracil-DNA glycosylase
MGGDGIAIGATTGARETASALRWWMEMGVDTAVQEAPRNWLERPVLPEPDQAPSQAPAPLPQSLDEFRTWLAGSDAPLSSAASRPVMPEGVEGAQLMILTDPPTREELACGRPVGGPSSELLNRMLAAIGMTGQTYIANLACFHSPGSRLTAQQIEQCAAAARHHVALARPKRLLLLGDLATRALLGKRLAEARGHAHKVEGVRTIATFHPRLLLKRPSDKALAWADLLLLMEEDN